MKVMRLACYYVIACFVGAPVFGHHHPPGIDETSITKVEGIVAGIRWVNPHVMFWITVGEDSDRDQW